MKIAFQMENLEQVVLPESNSWALIVEACRRGHEVYHYEPQDLSLVNQNLFAKVARVELRADTLKPFILQKHQAIDLSKMDVVFFRQDPPFDMAYFTNTIMLERLKAAGVLLVNDPYWIRNMPDKFSIFDYPEFLPPMLISQDIGQISDFFAAHKDIVIKPLYSFHGHGIERTQNVAVAEEKLRVHAPEPLMLQPFLPDIYKGNKRFLFFGGIYVGAIKTMPVSDGDFRIYRDSRDEAYTPTKREEKLCEKLARDFKARELMFVGVDMIGDYLTEINVGSVGSLLRFNEVYGGSWEGKLWDVIEEKLKSQP